MKQYFRTLIISGMAALGATGAQAAPITEPGVHTEFTYRYEFDVSGSDISYPGMAFRNTATDEVVADPVLAQTIRDQMHPLREGIGRTGRIVIEMAYMVEIFETPVQGNLEDDWLQVDCLSGFFCDFGFLMAQYRDHTFGNLLGNHETSFGLYDSDITWQASFDGTGGGTVYYDGDDYYSGTSVTIDGVTYAPFSDGIALFQLGNVSATRLDPPIGQQPIPTPLPAPVFMLIGALGGTALLRRRAAA